MARAGINKHLVEKARQTLMNQGKNPSIDAIRVELGNTGSKTTISRYLKEIEAEETVQLEDEALLSTGIKAMIAQLASKLHQEANDIVNQAEDGFKATIKKLETKCTQQQQSIDDLNNQKEKSEATAIELAKGIEERDNALLRVSDELEQSKHKCHEQEAIVGEKNQQIQSLNESHQHARESLTHYRESVKEQREQEQRQHEFQVQQLHTEIRKMKQTLINKQGNITELNKDNSRLVTEYRNTHKLLLAAEAKLDSRETELQSVKMEQRAISERNNQLAAQLKTIKEAHSALLNDSESTTGQIRDYELKIARLETELSTKDQLLDKFSS